MTVVYIVLAVIWFLLLFFFLAMKGRKNFDGIENMRDWYYAHRGLHSEGVPENSMAAFRAAKEAGFGVELDVHLLADGKLAVIHDSSLLRTAGVDVVVEELTASDLREYTLEGTEERIPLLTQVLNYFHGEIPVIVELKTYKGNASDLCEAAWQVLKDYEGDYYIEAFDPRCVVWLRSCHPDTIRGQLTQNYFRSKNKLPFSLKFMLRHQLLNCMTKPDFVAYKFEDRITISNIIARKVWGIQGVAWTITSQEDFDLAIKEGWVPIFEGFIPE